MSDATTLYKVLESPIVTEKSTMNLAQGNQVVFRVAKWSNKKQIKAAVEKIFKVDVVQVRTLNNSGKSKRFGAVSGKRKDSKKALVRLKDEQSIDFMEFNK